MRSFINNIAAEISRMDAFALSSSKSDFIDSVRKSSRHSHVTNKHLAEYIPSLNALDRNSIC